MVQSPALTTTVDVQKRQFKMPTWFQYRWSLRNRLFQQVTQIILEDNDERLGTNHVCGVQIHPRRLVLNIDIRRQVQWRSLSKNNVETTSCITI